MMTTDDTETTETPKDDGPSFAELDATSKTVERTLERLCASGLVQPVALVPVLLVQAGQIAASLGLKDVLIDLMHEAIAIHDALKKQEAMPEMNDAEIVARAWREAIPMFDLLEEDMPLAEMIFLGGLAAAFDMLSECTTFEEVCARVDMARAQALQRTLDLTEEDDADEGATESEDRHA